MSDFIRREDAIEAVCRTRCRDKAKGCPAHSCPVIEEFDALQSAEAEWIPCSERLPEYPDEVLTTYIVNGNRRKRYVETATYYDGDEGYWSSPWDEYRVAGTRVTVLAWMPLPKPYREEREDYELATEQMEHDAMYEPTYNSEDGSM